MGTPASELKTFVVVGGGGYIGYHVGISLFRKGHNVRLFDITKPDPEWVEGDLGQQNLHKGTSLKPKPTISFVQGNITSMEDLEEAFSAADCVILCASYGMSGKEQMLSEWDKTEAINITGARNVISACISRTVSSLVYTSTFNVVFGGQEVHNGGEDLPYFPLHRHVDNYSRTKSIAEQLIIMADTKTFPDSSGMLRTCALRLAGVMGVGEKRHLPRIVRNLPFFWFRYGYGESLVQFVSLSNVVQAHVKAAEEIITNPGKVGGQAYFISDGEPISNFDYFKPLIQGLGYTYPRFVLPMWIIWIVAYVCQVLHLILTHVNPKWSFTPLLTPAEVFKTSVTHYFSNDKATRDLGFVPERPNDISDVIQYWKNQRK